MKKIRFHYFTITKTGTPKTLADVFATLAAADIGTKVKECNYSKIALDHIEQIGPLPSPIWVMRFSRLREDNWPGVTTLNDVSKDLDLDQDSFLSEDTYVLFDTEQNKVVVQYNHIGVRPGKIQEYLSQWVDFSSGGYRLLPVFTNDTMAKYKAKQIVTSVEVAIDGITPEDLTYFNGGGLMAAVSGAVNSDAVKMKVVFSVDARIKTTRLKRSFVTDLVEKVMGRGGEDDKIIVHAKEEESDAVELLNLLESRKCVEYDGDSVPRTSGRRLDPDTMFQMLRQAYREWV
ncbi:MAG: DUF6731 family protein [Pseudomonadota bacterium]